MASSPHPHRQRAGATQDIEAVAASGVVLVVEVDHLVSPGQEEGSVEVDHVRRAPGTLQVASPGR